MSKVVFDYKAITAAKIQLGIELPIKIRIVPARQIQNNLGIHFYKNGQHYIELSDYIRFVNQTNHTLWHELVHCAQAEQVLAEGEEDFSRVYKQYAGEGGASYHNNRFEVEARKIAKENDHKLLLRLEQ